MLQPCANNPASGSRSCVSNPCGGNFQIEEPAGTNGAPAPVLASRGLTGLFQSAVREVGRGVKELGFPATGAEEHAEDYRPNTILDTARLEPNAVLLNVYDVSDSEALQKINKVFTANDQVLVGGVFHAGVEVFGKEWGYGSTEEDRTGVGAVPPRMHPQHTYRATVPMGTTALSKDEVQTLVRRLSIEWRGQDYNLIHNNCCSFCNAFLKELGLRRIPGWVDRAARAASRLDKTITFVKAIGAEGVQGQTAMQALEGIKRDSAKALEGIDSAQVQAKALELGEKAQERMQALGASLWEWGQGLSSGPKSGTGAAAVLDSIRDLGDRAQDVQKLTQDAFVNLTGVAAGGRREDPPNDVPNNANTCPALDDSSTMGFIRAQEHSTMRAGLLDDYDEEDDGGLCAYTAQDMLPIALKPENAPARTEPAVRQVPQSSAAAQPAATIDLLA